jgi:hypothetical protein
MAIIVRYNWDRQFFVRHELKLKNQLFIANCRIQRPAGLSSIRDIASNPTTYDILFITDCKSAYYLEILTMLGGAVYREGPEMWPIFGSSIVTVSEVTKRSVSSSLWRKVEQQSIAVLHITLFSRQYHCSIQWHHFWANCVATLTRYVPLCVITIGTDEYSLDQQYVCIYVKCVRI